jgi:hypothetical protein
MYMKLQIPALNPLINKEQNISRIALGIVNGFHLEVKLKRSARLYCSIKMRQSVRSYCSIKIKQSVRSYCSIKMRQSVRSYCSIKIKQNVRSYYNINSIWLSKLIIWLRRLKLCLEICIYYYLMLLVSKQYFMIW